ncbi:MAG: tetratricopeptide repeat protein [Candidatus Obscuribacterales bacterium]|nr:tetratricopeptide repeat protein [Candidatus Obscuribacterales bacterium]
MVVLIFLASNTFAPATAAGGKKKSAPVKANMEQRIRALEKELHGTYGKGDLEKRLSELEAKVKERNSNNSPQIAPTFAKQELKSPDSSKLDLKEAIKLHQAGKTAEAEVLFKKVVKDSPYNADASYSLGVISESKGDLSAALGYYTTAAMANPDDKESRKAIQELQEKIAAKQDLPFVNPLTPGSNVLQARAIDVESLNSEPGGSYTAQQPQLNYANSKHSAPHRGHAQRQNPVPTVGVVQNPRQTPTKFMSPVARGVTNAALQYALRGTGLHCPLGSLLRF